MLQTVTMNIRTKKIIRRPTQK